MVVLLEGGTWLLKSPFSPGLGDGATTCAFDRMKNQKSVRSVEQSNHGGQCILESKRAGNNASCRDVKPIGRVKQFVYDTQLQGPGPVYRISEDHETI